MSFYQLTYATHAKKLAKVIVFPIVKIIPYKNIIIEFTIRSYMIMQACIVRSHTRLMRKVSEVIKSSLADTLPASRT